MTIRSILREKGNAVVTIDPAITVAAAAAILAEKKIGALVALDEGGGVVGIVSERDVVRCIAREGAAALDQPVSVSAMTRTVTTTDEDATVDEAMRLMTLGRFRHLPVCDGDRLVGIVSIGDIVKRRIESVEREAEQMRTYIHAGG